MVFEGRALTRPVGPFARRPLIAGIGALLVVLLGTTAACSNASKSAAEDPKPTATAREAGEQTSAQELFLKANEYLDARRYAEAIATYRKVVERDAQRWEAYLNMAIAHSQTGDFNAALEAVDQCLAHGGEGKATVYFNLGNIYQKRGLYEQAVKAYRTSLAHDGSERPDVDTLVNIASALTVMGREKDAMATYQKAQSLAPQDPRIQHGLAVLYFLDGQEEKSARAFEQLQAMAPDYARTYFDRAMIYARLKRWEDAASSLETYLQKAPESELADRAGKLLEVYREKAREADHR